MRIASAVIAAVFAATVFSGGAQAERYKKSEIADARFGTGMREHLLTKAHLLAETINQRIFGQSVAAQVLEDRVVQYLENFPNRTGAPITLNMIGLPGIGKSGIVKVLKDLGFPVIHMDAQKLQKNESEFSVVMNSTLFGMRAEKNSRPVILVVEELDKIAEIEANGKKESTNSIIGTLNEIISDGRYTHFGMSFDASNIMVILTMNFSPVEIEEFSKDALGEHKSYYDFSVEDFAKFDEWIRNRPSSRAKVLARLFRSNTVSRLSPNTIILEPLNMETYRRIVDMVVEEVKTRNTTGVNAAKRIDVEIDPSLNEFLTEETTYAPSGARENIYRADQLTEQLITYGIKAVDPNRETLNVPRNIKIRYDREARQAVIEVTPVVHSRSQDRPLQTFETRANFDKGSRLFLPPKDLAVRRPPEPVKAQKEKPLTKQEVIKARYPVDLKKLNGFADYVNSFLFGQAPTVEIVEKDLSRYLGRAEPAVSEPSYRVLAGFPGIGKSQLVKLAAEHLKLPIVKVNMQQFSSDAPDTVSKFLKYSQQEISKVTGGENRRFIFLIEELDKVFEVDGMGQPISRPIMGIIKDLLNDGYVRGDGGFIDIRGAFTFITMNFSVDLFGFKADPRLTSIEDVKTAWMRLNSRPADVKNVLSRIFLPETISRLMARFTIMKPLEGHDYLDLIESQLSAVVADRLEDADGRNKARIDVELADSYLDFLFADTVIPSEGARHTVLASQALIKDHLERALEYLPRRWGARPLKITLKFERASSEVVATVTPQDTPEAKPEVITKFYVEQKFPDPKVDGPVSPERMQIAAHEFGHAFVSVRLGQRIDFISVVSPVQGTGGYVKFKGPMISAQELIAHIYAAVASRALERIVLAPDPRASESVLYITAGPSRDIMQATQLLFETLNKLGFDPLGGTLDRTGGMPFAYANFASIPAEKVEAMGRVLRDMENYIVEDLLLAHTQEWYREKIVKLAKAGGMNEKAFYELIGYQYPGDDVFSYGAYSRLSEIFGDAVIQESASRRRAATRRQDDQKHSVADNMARYLKVFSDSVKLRLYNECADALVAKEKPKAKGKKAS